MLTKTLVLFCRQTLAAVRRRAVARGLAALAAAAALCCAARAYSGDRQSEEVANFVLLRDSIGIASLTARSRNASAAGCRVPALDPFSAEVLRARRHVAPIVCDEENNWVDCYKSECFVTTDTLDKMYDVKCVYRDILFKNDYETAKGEPVLKAGGARYRLARSDHVEVDCTGKNKSWSALRNMMGARWHGCAAGLRALPAGRAQPRGADAVNVAVLIQDSVSHATMVREMPKTHQYLIELGAVILNSYNIVGEGTAGAMFPILTGRNCEEVNNTSGGPKLTIDPKDFIFHEFEKLGYRTAYMEDWATFGTFQKYYNGFQYQPVDHYLRTFTLEADDRRCTGSAPKYKLLMSLTEQLMQVADKYFLVACATVAHGEEELLATLDDEFASHLRQLNSSGRLDNTLLLVMGDHGPRFQHRRNTLQGRLEERLPFVAITLPQTLVARRPAALASLRANADVLSTPYDVHTTILDAVGLAERANDYKVPNVNLTRGLSLLKPVPRWRGCGAASVGAHWCACAEWRALPAHAPQFRRVAAHLAGYINELTAAQRSQCAERTLTSTEWVHRLNISEQVLNKVPDTSHTYQVYKAKITMGPLVAEFEGTVVFDEEKQEFSVDRNAISRANRYNDEPHCVADAAPALRDYCLCRDVLRAADPRPPDTPAGETLEQGIKRVSSVVI